MSDENILDIAHLSFLDMIKVMITLSGAASAKGMLIRNAIKTAERIAEVDDFLDAVRRVGRGGSIVDPDVVREVIARRRRDVLVDRDLADADEGDLGWHQWLSRATALPRQPTRKSMSAPLSAPWT